MSRRFVCILLTISLVCRALADRNEFASIVRTRNSLKAARPKSNDSLEESLDKQPRTTSHRLESDLRDKSNMNRYQEKLKLASSSCCGPRYDSNSSTRPDARYNRIPVDSNRYSVKFGDRLPVDRYGWQTQGQPAGSSGSTGRPGAGFYDGSHAGERFGSRPSYTTDSPRKPNGYGNTGYGGYGFNRPSNYGGSIGYGISGSFDNGEEFGPGEPNYPEENAPSRPNIQTQKAVALKALAGVALIGAAAALATNPVLLPIGVVSGRKKRSSMSNKDRDAYMDYILTFLKNNITKNYNVEDERKMSFSPACIARLTCEIEKDYWFNLRKGINFSKEKPALERRLVDRISNNIPNEEFANTRIRKLIKAATTVAASGKSCNVFTCTLVKATETERPVIFKF
ncbi:PREDICTED: uncharacterized protein LOC108571266 [Habropoda laboriosa]|uniref:uncharacterized protein LOC108571266 n=1 Tax=Habropoda laboriosa TaxID=597456 RepID=UPI00083DA89F|nr:PREDICTED: uncharacterized protein LOC108571266 [Habropoda laboriosa]